MKRPAATCEPDHATVEVRPALRPITSLISKSAKARQKVAPGTWPHTMLRDNLKALHIASALIDQGTHSMDRFTQDDLRGALTAIDSMRRKTEEAQAIRSLGKSQHALLRNRLKSLRIAKSVVKSQLNER